AIPTKLPITFSCGQTETKDLSSTPAGKRKSRAYGLGKHFVCAKCFKKQGQQNLDEFNKETLADAMGFEKEYDLPELEGSEKQVPCATKSRYEVPSEITDSDETPSQHAQANNLFAIAPDLTTAGWWIDNFRDTSDLQVDGLIELITTAVDEPDEDRIDTENPF